MHNSRANNYRAVCGSVEWTAKRLLNWGAAFFASEDRGDSEHVDRVLRVYRPIDFQANPLRP
jgi:hypothetical protein